MKRWNKLIKYGLAAALSVWFTASPAGAIVVDRIVAKVNGDIVTLSSVQERAAILQQTGRALENSLETERALLEFSLQELIDELLQVQNGEKVGLKISDKTVQKAVDDLKAKNKWDDKTLVEVLKREGMSLEQYKKRIRRQILKSRAVSYNLQTRIKVSEKAMKKYYLEHAKDFWVPEKIHLRHILFIFDADVTPQHQNLKRAKAREVLKKIRGGADFSEMAKKYSEDVTASSGGDLGVLEKGKMVAEFERAAFELEPGGTSDIVKTKNGLHIIRTEKIIPGHTKLYSDVRKEIEGIVFASKKDGEFKEWLGELRKTAFIETTLYDDDKSEGGVAGQIASLPQKGLFKVKEEPAEKNTDPFIEEPDGLPEEPAAKSLPPLKNGAEENGTVDYAGLKKQLRYIKSLKDKKIISEAEYQQRKQKLLKKL